MSISKLMQKLDMTHPIIQAPMAGGGDTPPLVAAVSAAGGLGSIGAAYLSPAQIAEAARQVREKTDRAFAINLFAPLPVPDRPSETRAAIERLKAFYEELGLPEPELAATASTDFDAQLAAVLESGARGFSFTFGMVPEAAIAAAKSKGLVVMGTATTVDEAVALERAGVDAVIAQGSEAGGHRGSFLTDFEMAMVGTMALVPQVVDAVKIPVIASGGIADGRGLAAALALGAEAVQIGTAFLTTEEAGIAEAYKERLLAVTEVESRLTRAFSGRPARGLVNRVMTKVEDPALASAVLPFPWQNALTRPMRSAATQQNKTDYLSLWAGQAVRLLRRQKAADLVTSLVTEMETTIDRLRRRK
ncbi:NAD(P)H-dependent flavin oxidoreductase [Dongia soli]|uniref:Propionate 3-nitronate monooxygenase n=1 Tax=Dongia soli TaxID=600628 RepID=A0ABU5EK98_9PROT|nr:nitronate monooxygenase [Dongia soli]MDY0885618.1 nitronate monooxygenase [Dongia soli]